VPGWRERGERKQTCGPQRVGFLPPPFKKKLFLISPLLLPFPKSVAHLPWRQLAYKFLGTIVDDLFAFVIKMPTLHRLVRKGDTKKGKKPTPRVTRCLPLSFLTHARTPSPCLAYLIACFSAPLLHAPSTQAVFRDDIVFCVYLYQRWAYRVDRSRANEYGFAAEPAPGGAGAAAAAAPEAATTGVGSGAVTAGVTRRRGGGGGEAAAAADLVGGAAEEEVKKDL
jgi:hypothetical protein